MIDVITSIFNYNEKHPLIFTQFYFWAFFAFVLVFYNILYQNKKRSVRSGYLFLVSLFFYFKASGFFFFILIFSTLVDYFIGNAIYKSDKQLKRKILLTISITVNLLLLGYFKYAYFFVDAFNSFIGEKYQVINHLALIANHTVGTHFSVNQILLPVGISFFTFQTISYSIDIFRRHVKPVKNIIDFGFYVSFFPQLVAGPIVRAADFVPQIYSDYKVSREDFGFAVWMVLKGLIKKILIGDYIAVNFVDRVFGSNISYTGFENLMGLYGYSLQVYCDFSGYTDIAIGIALLLGFRLPVNFNAPYKAKSTGEFWKRWHISLSSWLKDYLYIPLGGNRKGSVGTWIALTVILLVIVLLAKWIWLLAIFAGIVLLFFILAKIFPGIKRVITTNINIMITMLLGGLWHGSSWMFIIWGGLNGIGIVVNKFWKQHTQTGRWIIFGALNALVLLSWTIGLWNSPDGFLIWAIMNLVWGISYLVWFIYRKAKDRKFMPVRYSVALFLTAGFCFIIMQVTGLWYSGEGNQYWWGVAMLALFITAYFLLKSILRINWVKMIVIANATASGVLLYLGYDVLVWFVVATVLLLMVAFWYVKSRLTDRPFLVYFWGVFLTFNFITFTRIWFRGESIQGTWDLLTQISTNFRADLIPEIIAGYKWVFIAMIAGFVLHWWPDNLKERYKSWFIRTPLYIKIVISTLVVFVIYQSISADMQPFIYFQF